MITTLEETIARVKDVAEMNSREAEEIRRISESITPSNKQYRVIIERCRESAEEYEQVAAWLEELKERREADRWIPVSERLPDDLEPVNITWINHEPEPYYKEIKDKPFTATGVYFNGQWYWWSTLCTDTLAEYSHNYDDIIDKDIEVTAWKPLPKPYESEATNER